jgi:hypothetical protein
MSQAKNSHQPRRQNANGAGNRHILDTQFEPVGTSAAMH